MRQANATILYNDPIAPSFFRMGLKWPCGDPQPGQFVMVLVNGRGNVLLRRPFSISAVIYDKNEIMGIELLYKVVGKATRILSECRKNDQLDVLGPLGKGFDCNNFNGCNYFVAGGIGVAPIRFLTEYLARAGKDLTCSKVFLGGRSRKELLCGEDFQNLGLPVILTTDDGSAGDQCLVTHPLELAVEKKRPQVIFACGPSPMLSCVAGIAGKHKVPCQLSIETMMACGMGACLGCATESSQKGQGYLHACLDGPVFDAATIKI